MLVFRYYYKGLVKYILLISSLLFHSFKGKLEFRNPTLDVLGTSTGRPLSKIKPLQRLFDVLFRPTRRTN